MNPAFKPVPITKLPLLPVMEILSSMDPARLFSLSCCSKKAKSLVKFVTRKVVAQYRVGASFNYKCVIRFEPKNKRPRNYHVRLPEHSNSKAASLAAIRRAQNVMDQILNLFHSMKIRGHFFFDLHGQRGKAIFDWARLHKDSLEQVVYSGRISKHRNVQKFLDTFTNCQLANIRTQTKANFVRVHPIEIETLIIKHGRWFTMENLRNFKGKDVRILDSRLTNADVNQFLKDWRSGTWSNPYLHTVYIERDDTDVPLILHDIPHTTHAVHPDRELFNSIGVWYWVESDDRSRVAKMYRSKKSDKDNIGIKFY